MARKALANDDEGKMHCAFLGFGSLEALAEALKPKPIPPEVGERQWQRIAERIRQEEGSPSDTDPPPSSPLPPAAAVPAVALPALVPPAVPVLVTLGKGTMAGLLAVVFVGGISSSAGGVVALQAHEESHGRAAVTAEACPALTAAPWAAPSSTVTAGAAAPSEAPSTAPSSTAAPSTTASNAIPSTAPRTTAAPSAGESQRLLAQMLAAMQRRQFSEVLTLAERHARQFGATHVQQREALRIEALRQTGRAKDAEQHARTVTAAHPEHRRAMERAAGHTLP